MCVSVVMAVYNGERFLAESVESVLNQTMPELELIAVDDGSTDSSRQILAGYARNDRRVTVIHQDHAGVPAAANHGVRQAKYGLIARTDSDDRMLPQRLERQVAFLRENPEAHLVCGNCYFINASGRRIGTSCCSVDVERGRRELRPSLFLELTQSTVLMKKDALIEIGGYREDFQFGEDRDLWGRFATGGYTMMCQSECLVEYRLHDGAMTMKRAALQYELCSYIDENVKRRLLGQAELTLAEYRAARRRKPLAQRLREEARFLALHSFKRATRHYGEGQYWRCALSLAAAMSLNPAHIVGRALKRRLQPGASHA